MPGFNFEYNTPYKNLPQGQANDRPARQVTFPNGSQINNFFLDKFEDDKLFEDRYDFFVLLDGVITNKKDLIESCKTDNWFDCIVNLYQIYGEQFFSRLRGSFRGMFYDKRKDKWMLFTDHIGSKVIYYSQIETGIFISSRMSDMYKYFQINHLSYDLSLDGAYMLLSYGYMLHDFTLCSRVKKILAGNYLKIEKGKISTHSFYSLPSNTFSKTLINEDEIVDKLDDAFRRAVARQFDKDVEYGYKHLVALSGGLDSRMTSWVADELGYHDQYNFTFSQSNYLDEIIAKKIATDLKHEWIFKALDNGVFLKNMELVIALTGGNVLFSGKSHGLSMLSCLDFDRFGMIHSGQLGDVVVGSFLNNQAEYNKKPEHAGYYSAKFLDKIQYKFDNEYPNQELFLMNQRAFNGANSGLICTMHFTETLSPFYDVEFMEYCFSLPPSLRIGHYLYKKWVSRKYPRASGYVWEKTRRPVAFKSLFNIKYKNRTLPIEDVPRLLKNKFFTRVSVLNTPNFMNPFDYWYNTNERLKYFFDEYFESNIERAEGVSEELFLDLKRLYQGTTLEKTQVLTLLGAIKLFY